MKRFKITSRAGVEMGVYSADSAEGAVRAMNKDAGYANDADVLVVTGRDSIMSDVFVEEVVDDQQSITPDEENGCEVCWEIARQIADVDSGVVTAEEYKRLKAAVGRCTHGAPEYATSIFVEFQS